MSGLDQIILKMMAREAASELKRRDPERMKNIVVDNATDKIANVARDIASQADDIVGDLGIDVEILVNAGVEVLRQAIVVLITSYDIDHPEVTEQTIVDSIKKIQDHAANNIKVDLEEGETFIGLARKAAETAKAAKDKEDDDGPCECVVCTLRRMIEKEENGVH